MADPIAEALVAIRPDFSGFQAQLQAGVNQAFRNLKVPPATQQTLGSQMFGPGFQSAAQTGTTNAIKNTKIPANAPRTLAQQLFGSAFRDESGRALQGALSGLGLGQLAAQSAFFGPGGAGISVAVAGLGAATVAAASFDQALTVLQATTDATDEQIRQASEAAQQLGRDLELPGVSATDAANAILELGKAGLSMQNAIAGADGTLRLAAAAQIDAGTAAQIAASGLNAFSLAGDQASHIADLLAGASIAAQGDIGDMALALQQSAAVADQAGLSIEQLVGLITELARQGILGSDAGTSIRTMLLRLTPTTKEAAQFMEALGIQLDQTRSLGEQLPEVLDQYQRALARLNPIQRQQALTQIFGTDAIRSATVAIENGSKGLERATDAANKQGAAAKLAASQAEGATGAFAELGDAGQAVGVTLGQVTLPAVESLTRGLTDLLLGADAAARGLGGLISADIGRLDAIFGGGADGADDLTGRIREIGDELDEVLGRFGDFGESFDRVLSGNVRLPGELQVANLVQELRDELQPALQQGNITIAEARDLLAALHLPPELIREFRDLVPEAQALPDAFEHGLGSLERSAHGSGERVGRSFGEGVADGIDATEQLAIDAARRNLADLRRRGEDQITEAVRSARSNFESLRDSISSSLEDIIDVGPIAQEIDKVDAALDRLHENVTRRSLRFDFSDAKRELREAQRALQEVGVPTPGQRRAQQEFLAPFKQKVGDAKSALKEFDLEQHKKDLEGSLEKQKKVANEGLAVLIDKFEDGKISAGEFAASLQNQLAPQMATLQSQSKNLGFVFTQDFKRDLAAVVSQAKALSGFLGRAGTTPGAQVIRPAETVSDVQRQLAEAERALAQQIKTAKEKNTEENGQILAVLRQIRDAQLGKTPTTGGRTPSRGGN